MKIVSWSRTHTVHVCKQEFDTKVTSIKEVR